MAKDFLLEVGVETMPARFFPQVMEQLLFLLGEKLKESRLRHNGEVRRYATPRRLGVLVAGVEEKSEALSQEIQGPPARLLRGADGAFTPQAEGFARKNNLKADQLGTVQTPKGEFLLARVTAPGEPAIEVLSRIIPEVLGGLQFPKTMEWEVTRFRFGRPIRGLVALFGKSVVPVTIAGVKSGRSVRGLPGVSAKPVSLPEPKAYEPALKKLIVLADEAERRDVLLRRLSQEAKKLGAKIDLEDPLVEETVYMTEHPVPVVGRFRDEFLKLPAPLLALVLRKQLKFFPLYSHSGHLISKFIGVRDGVSEGQDLVREGYERVLTARCDDAVFFFERDRAAKLADRSPLLERVTYQKALGSMADKTKRVRALAMALYGRLPADFIGSVRPEFIERIAGLCYADLVTEVVKEFPELQGIMGGVYARLEGQDERIALGLEEFYQPLGPKAAVPTTVEGAIVSLAGKLDSLAGCFIAGLAPTGNADPFALRRQALGAIRTLLEKQLPIGLDTAITAALEGYSIPFDKAKTERELREFLWGRAQSFFEDKGFKIDEIRSVRRGALASLKRTYLRLCAVQAVRKQADFEPLAAAFKRASNIVKQAGGAGESNGMEREGLKEEAEVALYDALSAMEGRLQEKLDQDGFEDGLRALVGIKPQLDRFFDQVMVMAEDPALRKQRLALLSRLVRLFNTIADLSEIQGPSAN